MTEDLTQAIPKAARRGRNGANWQAILFYVGLIAIWQFVSWMGWVRPFILPGPVAIVQAAVDGWRDLLLNAIVTIRETFIGFVIGSLLGFVLAAGIFYSRFIRRIVYPFAVFMQTVPKLALAPVFIVWFGTGETSIVAITSLICLFPVLVNTVVGFETVDRNLLEMMHSVSANEWQKFTMIYLPASLPQIVAGLELGSSLAVVGALVGEFVGSRAGLGFQILLANSQIATDEVFAALIVVSLVGMGFFFGVKALGRLLLRGRGSSREEKS